MVRGEIYAARLDPAEGSEQAGTRPVVIVSNDVVNDLLPTVTVVPITRHRSGRFLSPGHVPVPRAGTGLRTNSLAVVHQVRTIAKSRIGGRVGSVAATTMRRIDAALALHFGLDV